MQVVVLVGAEGRMDGRSQRTILGNIAPRTLVIVRGTSEVRSALLVTAAASCPPTAGMCICPNMVNPHSFTDAWHSCQRGMQLQRTKS